MFFSRIHSKNRFLSFVLLLVSAVCTGTHTLGLAADRVTLSFIPSKSKPAAGSVAYHYSLVFFCLIEVSYTVVIMILYLPMAVLEMLAR